jgi:protein TonB
MFPRAVEPIVSMADSPKSAPRVNTSAGHLSVHVEGAHPPEVMFQFEEQQKRLVPAMGVSLLCQIALVAVIVLAARLTTHTVETQVFRPDPPDSRIIWLAEPGPGGGGGGGGNQMKEPPRKAELPGKDKISVPVSKPKPVQPPKPKPKEEPPVQIAQLNIPAQVMGAALENLPGLIEAPAGPPTLSQGSGSGGGAGTGTGSGAGPGTGSGLGPGSGGGTGGGVYRPGSGVTLPRLVREVKPQYTSDAMRAKVQGTVLLECIVRPDGSVSDVQVLRSLDSAFGLDQEAVKAARQWRFLPGTRLGEPVPVLITIELTFTLR